MSEFNAVGKAASKEIAKALLEAKYQEIEDTFFKALANDKGVGPRCPTHALRHMARVGVCEYACIESGQVWSLREVLWP